MSTQKALAEISVALRVISTRLKAYLRRAGQKLPNLPQRANPGFVHVDHHPLMIDPLHGTA
ncbi:MAG: hypothetical protein ACKVQU_19690 [Burkholderiales bacterium]